MTFQSTGVAPRFKLCWRRYYGATPSADAVALKTKIEEKMAASAAAPGFRKMAIVEEDDSDEEPAKPAAKPAPKVTERSLACSYYSSEQVQTTCYI